MKKTTRLSNRTELIHHLHHMFFPSKKPTGPTQRSNRAYRDHNAVAPCPLSPPVGYAQFPRSDRLVLGENFSVVLIQGREARKYLTSGSALDEWTDISKEDSTFLLAFGSNEYCQCGRTKLGDCSPYPSPVKIPARHEIQKVSCGFSNCCALIKDYQRESDREAVRLKKEEREEREGRMVFAGGMFSGEQGSWLSGSTPDHMGVGEKERRERGEFTVERKNSSDGNGNGSNNSTGDGEDWTCDIYTWGKSNVGQAGRWKKPSVCPPRRMKELNGSVPIDVWCGGDATAIWVEE